MDVNFLGLNLIGWLVMFELWCWFRKWTGFIATLPPRIMTLTLASHGAAMIMLTIAGAVRLHISNPWVIGIPIATGLFWFVIGYNRSFGPRDAWLTGISFVKGALGLACFCYGYQHPRIWDGFGTLAFQGVGLFFGTSGAVTTLLLMRGMPRVKMEEFAAQETYGHQDFGDGLH